MSSNKMERVDSELLRELNNIIAYELKDPRLSSMVTITEVETAKDLKTAKVYVSVLEDNNINDVLEALNKSNGFIRKQLFDRLKIRMVPHFTFIADNSIAYGFKIDKILKTLNQNQEENND